MYYELIIPESPEGIKTVNKLKNLNVLKWEKDIYWEGFSKTEMTADKERIFLFLDNKIKTYRIDSGAKIFHSHFSFFFEDFSKFAPLSQLFHALP